MKRCSPPRKSKDLLKVSKFVQSQPDSSSSYTDSWSCIEPLRQSPCVPVNLKLVNWSYIEKIPLLCCARSVSQQMHGQRSLQIICTYRQKIYFGHVSDSLGKTK